MPRESGESEKSGYTSFYIVLLVASIFAFSAVSSFVVAYSFGDFANDLQKLFAPSGTSASTGGVFDLINNLFGTQYSSTSCQTCGLNRADTSNNIQAGQPFKAYCFASQCNSNLFCEGFGASISGPENENCAFSTMDANGAVFSCRGHPAGTYTLTCVVGTGNSCHNSKTTCGGESQTRQFTIFGQQGGTTCTPSCSGRPCGAPNGCGGICTAGYCTATGQVCVNGVCQTIGGGSCPSQTRSCNTTSQNCPGTQVCSNGNWGTCVDNPGDNCPSTDGGATGCSQYDGNCDSCTKSPQPVCGYCKTAKLCKSGLDAGPSDSSCLKSDWAWTSSECGGTGGTGGTTSTCSICPNCPNGKPDCTSNSDFPDCNLQTHKCCKPNGYGAVGHKEYCCSGQIDVNGFCIAGTGGGTGTSGTCTNPFPFAAQPDLYGVTLCGTFPSACTWQGTDNVQVSPADSQGNIQVTFSSQYANGVNVFIRCGGIVGVPAGSVPGYARIASGGDVCAGVSNLIDCNPSAVVSSVAGDFCSFKQNQILTNTNTNPISTTNPARALMPLNLGGSTGSTITIRSIGTTQIGTTQLCNGNIDLFVQFYREMAGQSGGASSCTSTSNRCSPSGCPNFYAGCSDTQTSANSYLCIHSNPTSSAAVPGYSCWHYPWETIDGWLRYPISMQGTIITTTTTTTTTNTASSSTTSSTSSSTTSSTTSSTSSSTTSSTSSSTTSTTTPTTPLPLVISCKDCLVNSQCECSISQSDCSSGLWTAKNKVDTPLPHENTTDIPPYTILFYPNQTGSVNVTARCFDAFPKSRSNSTEVPVLNPFLVCPPSAPVNTPTSCQISNCNSGFANVVQNNVILAGPSFTSSPFSLTFTAPNVGTASITAVCQNPARPSITATVQILGATTTTAPPQGIFTGTDFKCVRTDGSWECSFLYNNKVGQDIIVQFIFAKDGKVETVPPAPKSNTVGSGSAVTKVTLECSSVDSGNYVVSWKAYRDETKRNPIAWSTPSSELPQIDCP